MSLRRAISGVWSWKMWWVCFESVLLIRGGKVVTTLVYESSNSFHSRYVLMVLRYLIWFFFLEMGQDI